MKAELESTKKINALKLKAIKQGGYDKFKNIIIEACLIHKSKFGKDLTPIQLKVVG